MNKWRVLSTILLFATATICLAAPVDVPVPEGERQPPKDSPLHQAVQQGEVDRETLAKILESGVDINAKNARGASALHYAQPETAERLLMLGADVDSRDNRGNTPLHHASPEKGRILIAYGADINARDFDDDTPLHCQSDPGNADAWYIRFLIDRGADVNAKNDYGITPLWESLNPDMLMEVDEEVVCLLLERGADVNARASSQQEYRYGRNRHSSGGDYYERAPLHLLIVELPHLFLQCVDNGADLNTTDRFGETLMHYAAGSDGDLIGFLADHCGDIHARDASGRTPLFTAAGRETMHNLRRLVALGADVNAKDNYGATPVFSAIGGNRNELEAVKFLHANGASLDLVTAQKMTLLHLAVRNYGGEPCVEFLIEHGLSVHAKDHAGNTPLHIAADKNYSVTMIDLLMRHGADVNARNNEQQTPLHKAVDTSFGESRGRISCLIGHGAQLEAVDAMGRTALHYFIGAYNGLERAEVLFNAGADVHMRGADGRTLLHCVADGQATNARIEWLDYLLFAGLDINAKDDAGNTPLHIAAKKYSDMVKKLLDAGADPTIRNHAGQLPADVAAVDAKRVLMEVKEREDE